MAGFKFRLPKKNIEGLLFFWYQCTNAFKQSVYHIHYVLRDAHLEKIMAGLIAEVVVNKLLPVGNHGDWLEKSSPL